MRTQKYFRSSLLSTRKKPKQSEVVAVDSCFATLARQHRATNSEALLWKYPLCARSLNSNTDHAISCVSVRVALMFRKTNRWPKPTLENMDRTVQNAQHIGSINWICGPKIQTNVYGNWFLLSIHAADVISQHNIFRRSLAIYLKHVHVKIIILQQNIVALLIKDVVSVCENICRLKIIWISLYRINWIGGPTFMVIDFVHTHRRCD